MISSKTGDDAASEFALGEAVFYQNGTWAYNDIKMCIRDSRRGGFEIDIQVMAVLLRRKQRVLRRIFRGLAAGGITEFAVVFICLLYTSSCGWAWASRAVC